MKYIKKFSFASVVILFAVFVMAAGHKDNGVGPIKNFKQKELNNDDVNKGKALFNSKCVACHRLDSKLIGPPLRDVTEEQSPEFIMNLLLNTVDMQKKDPYIKELIKKYNNVLMINPQVNEEQAKDLYEYLRYAYVHKPWQ